MASASKKTSPPSIEDGELILFSRGVVREVLGRCRYRDVVRVVRGHHRGVGGRRLCEDGRHRDVDGRLFRLLGELHALHSLPASQ